MAKLMALPYSMGSREHVHFKDMVGEVGVGVCWFSVELDKETVFGGMMS